MSHCYFSCDESFNQFVYVCYSTFSSYLTRTSTLPLTRIAVTDENKEKSIARVTPPLQCTPCSKLIENEFSL